VPEVTPEMITPRVVARFWAKVTRRGPDECWTWNGNKRKHGYGRVKLLKRDIRASHVALSISGRFRKDGQHALHSCDNPACVNPAHLRWGTNAENTADRVRRGRSRAKIAEDDVRKIREDRRPPRLLAQHYGLAPSTISQIKKGRSWSHVK
jgi:hypothetical protein